MWTRHTGEGEYGIGLLQVRVDDAEDPLVFNLPTEFKLTWHLGPLLSRQASSGTARSRLIVRCVDKTAQFTPSEYLYSEPDQVRWSKTYTARGIKSGTYEIALLHNGKGVALASGAHPEFGSDFLLERWGSPKILVNFIHIATSKMSINRKITRPSGAQLGKAVEAAVHLAVGEIRGD